MAAGQRSGLVHGEIRGDAGIELYAFIRTDKLGVDCIRNVLHVGDDVLCSWRNIDGDCAVLAVGDQLVIRVLKACSSDSVIGLAASGMLP